MKREDQWMDEVMKSTEGMERAKPNPFLFAKIEQKLAESPPLEAARTVVPRWSIAAAIILLALNASALWYASQPNMTESSLAPSNQQLISNYNLYDE